MRNAVVASTKIHAEAMIRWLKLDETWKVVLFGSFLDEQYKDAILVHPLTEITEWQFQWFETEFQPRVTGSMDNRPHSWGIPRDEFLESRRQELLQAG